MLCPQRFYQRMKHVKDKSCFCLYSFCPFIWNFRWLNRTSQNWRNSIEKILKNVLLHTRYKQNMKKPILYSCATFEDACGRVWNTERISNKKKEKLRMEMGKEKNRRNLGNEVLQNLIPPPSFSHIVFFETKLDITFWWCTAAILYILFLL